MSNRDLQEWLIKKIAGLLETDPDRIDIHEPFSHLGLSSRHAVELSGELETLLGKRFPPTLAYEYPSISSLAHFLAQETNVEAAALPAHTGKSNDEPIAIIGMSCRFPGADDPDAFWKILSEGVDCISEIPPDRWSKEAFYDPDPLVPGKSVSKWGGLLKNVDLFDPFFFGISPNEARQMDPQQRLLLELSYEALDHAGQDIEQLNGSFTGVYMGISVNEYSTVQFADPASITGHSGTGSALSISANRISYFFNFHGPSMAIDTACSASLAAVHLACKGLREGECDLALAGGVNIILSPAHSISFTKAGLLAKDGRCKSFDAAADGYVRGEGGGIVVLKPLSKAIADGDPVLAVIKGSAMVQDGRTNGLAAPNREAQEILLRQAYNVAGISPSEVQYVEAHGTGTLLGDSMEAAALGTVVGKDRKDQPCIIGSVKTNIGHLEAAAGVAGLIKVVLAMKHRMIPPSLHFHVPNPHIPFEDYHLKVQQTAESWPAHKGPALAAMSSFGFGGTLVHTVIEEAPLASQTPPEISIAAGHTYLLPLSANSSGSLKRFARSMLEMVEDNFDQSLKDICMAVAKRRSRFRHRMAVMGHNRHELAAGLRAFLKDEPFGEVLPENHVPERLPGMVFVFSGQGGQWMGMGRGLMALEPVFKETISQIDDLIQRLFGWSLMDTLMGTDAPEALEEIDRVQPAIFAIQTALAELWRSKGIVPDAVVGHSMGEVAAALVAGILSLEDAVRIVCIRSSLLKNIRGKGAMLATDLSEEESKEIINGHEADVSAAVFNGPTSTVLAGSPELLTQIQQKLEADNRFCRWVKVDVASHSPQIEPLRKEMMEALLDVKPMTARIPFYSTVTGAKGDGIVFDNTYWVDNIRKPVLFYSAIKQILESDHQVFIEAGPHPVLIGSVQQTADEKKLSLHLLPSMRNDEPEANVFFHTLGKL
jgi:acyl transferase domain-containing protein/acyl carrier protein